MSDRIKLDVNGQLYTVPADNIRNGPPSRLTRMYSAGLSVSRSERIVINRPNEYFAAILAFYQTGELHIPMTSCPGAFINELEYWEISPEIISDCCYNRLQRFLDEQHTINQFKDGQRDANTSSNRCFGRLRERLWETVNYTKPTLFGKVYFIVSVFMVLLSISVLACSTDPSFKRAMTNCERLGYMASTDMKGYDLLEPHLKAFCSNSQVPYNSSNSTGTLELMAQNDGNEDSDFLLFLLSVVRDILTENKIESNLLLTTPSNTESETKFVENYLPENHTLVTPSIIENGTKVEEKYLPENRTLVTPSNIESETKFVEKYLPENRTRVTPSIIENDTKVEEKYLPENRTLVTPSNIDNDTKVEEKYLPENRTLVTPLDKTNNTKIEEIYLPENLSLVAISNIANDTKFKNLNPIQVKTARELDAPLFLQFLAIEEVKIPNLKIKLLVLVILDYVTTIYFTVDFILRLASCPSIKSYFSSIINFTDALSLLGAYFYILLYYMYSHLRYGSWIEYFSYLQMLRCLRLFRIASNVRAGRVLAYSARKNVKDFLVLLLFLFAGICTFATLFYMVENTSTVKSIPDAWYWALITMTTVGYGDIQPQTNAGRLVSCMCAVAGILLLALTVPVFANHFLLLHQYVESEFVFEKIQRRRQSIKEGVKTITENGS